MDNCRVTKAVPQSLLTICQNNYNIVITQKVHTQAHLLSPIEFVSKK